MTRTEKYTLDRALIELENATNDLVEYCERRNILDRWFDNPMEQLDRILKLRKEDWKR